jgi:threonine/homoserine/homoserine lactone efflux protein
MAEVWLFLVGYALTLLTPGPNMLMIASVATVSGRRGVAPLIVGLCLGALSLAILLMATDAAIEHSINLRILGPLVSGGMLTYIGWRMAPVHHARPKNVSGPSSHVTPDAASRFGIAGLWCGYCTSISNPITSAYFASQFISDQSRLTVWPTAGAVLTGILLICAGRSLLIAIIFSAPRARARLLRHEHGVRRSLATVFAGLALWVAWPALLPVATGTLTALTKVVAGMVIVLPVTRVPLMLLAGIAAFAWLAPPRTQETALPSAPVPDLPEQAPVDFDPPRVRRAVSRPAMIGSEFLGWSS